MCVSQYSYPNFTQLWTQPEPKNEDNYVCPFSLILLLLLLHALRKEKREG